MKHSQRAPPSPKRAIASDARSQLMERDQMCPRGSPRTRCRPKKSYRNAYGVFHGPVSWNKFGRKDDTEGGVEHRIAFNQSAKVLIRKGLKECVGCERQWKGSSLALSGVRMVLLALETHPPPPPTLLTLTLSIFCVRSALCRSKLSIITLTFPTM